MNPDNELRHLFRAAEAEMPGEPLDWNPTITRARRSRMLRMTAAGAVAAGLVAGAAFGTAALRDQAPPPIPPAGPSPSPERPTPTPAPDRQAEEGVSLADAPPTIERFLGAAARGDAETMWKEMSPASKAAFDDDLAAFEAFLREGVSEGIGSWDAAEDRGLDFEVLASSGDGAVGVATVFGHRFPEGNDEPVAIFPIPIRIDHTDDAMVELWVEGSPGEAEFVTPEDLTPSAQARITSKRPTFEAVVPAPAGEVYMLAALVPDEPAAHESGIAEVVPAGEGKLRATWRPRLELFPAEWFLTVVRVHNDGTLSADATRFLIE